ncbi:caspase family protein [Neoroseomonas soli]|uniref:Caspase family protein n=1 Tax=Neoroseomonas soli TaxID=1081025 RepID=A0A9X9WY27_9PROT|nr:caspase family protein [Neoroseomonas soli]MBR0672056.1 caspase family protein [Neoroseomonas soli]
MRRLVILLVATLLLAALPAMAQRVALVVGAGAYRHVPGLANPPNDAADIAAALARLGFRTDLVLDPDRAQLEQAVRRLGQAARGAEAAVFYFAGHALEAGGRNWLLPVTAEIGSERDLRFEALDMDIVGEQLDGVARVSIVLLDACRDNPFRLRLAGVSRSATVGLGLAQLRAAVGTLVAFSTAPGTVAADGEGRNSPFTRALLRRIEAPGIELRQMLAEVRREVREATGGRQVPWEHSALEGAFYFVPPPAATAATGAARDAELVFWESVRASRNPADLQAYLARFPAGLFRDLAANRLRELGAPPGGGADRIAAPGAGAVTEESLATVLAARMTPEDAHRIAATYIAERGPAKAIAIQGVRRGSWRISALPENVDVAEIVLERCQIAYGAPCILVAVNDRLAEPGPPRPMPRVAHAGAFDLAQVPGILPTRRGPGADLARYVAGPEPKAMAMHPTGRFYWRTGAASRTAAEEAALNACNDDRERNRRDGPCLLYASDGQVVLPERRRTPTPP